MDMDMGLWDRPRSATWREETIGAAIGGPTLVVGFDANRDDPLRQGFSAKVEPVPFTPPTAGSMRAAGFLGSAATRSRADDWAGENPDWRVLLQWTAPERPIDALLSALAHVEEPLSPHILLPALLTARTAEAPLGRDVPDGRVAAWWTAYADDVQQALSPLIAALYIAWADAHPERKSHITDAYGLAAAMDTEQRTLLEHLARIVGQQAIDAMIQDTRLCPAVLRLLDQASDILWDGADRQMDYPLPLLHAILPLALWRALPAPAIARAAPPETIDGVVALWRSARSGTVTPARSATTAHIKIQPDTTVGACAAPVLALIARIFGESTSELYGALPVITVPGHGLFRRVEASFMRLYDRVPQLSPAYWPYDDIVFDCSPYLQDITQDNIRTGEARPHNDYRQEWIRVTRGPVWQEKRARFSPWALRGDLYDARYPAQPPQLEASLVVEIWTAVNGTIGGPGPDFVVVPFLYSWRPERYSVHITESLTRPMSAASESVRDNAYAMIGVFVFLLLGMHKKQKK